MPENYGDFVWVQGQPERRRAVYICCDGHWLPLAAFLALQIIEREQARDFDVMIVVAEPFEVPAVLKGSAVNLAQWIPGHDFDALPVNRSIPLAAYTRLFVPALVAEHYDRLLYLDSDIFLERPGLSEFLSMDLGGKPIGSGADVKTMLSDTYVKSVGMLDYWRRLGVGDTAIYRNSGVLLIDVATYMADECLPRMLDFARRRHGDLKYHDQSLVNAVLLDEMTLLSPKWNFPDIPGFEALERDVEPLLTHYVARPKPWEAPDSDFRSRRKHAYLSFLEEHFPAFVAGPKIEPEPGSVAANTGLLETLRDFVLRPRATLRQTLRRKLGPKGKFSVDPRKWQAILSQSDSPRPPD